MFGCPTFIFQPTLNLFSRYVSTVGSKGRYHSSRVCVDVAGRDSCRFWRPQFAIFGTAFSGELPQARTVKVWGRWKGAEIMAQNWTIAVGRLAPPPLACVPLSHLILLPCACYIGYSYRILHGKCGRTVFSYELLTYFKKSKEWDFWYKNSNLGNTVQSIFHVVLCSSLILRAFYFKSFWNAKISKKKKKKMAATHSKTDVTKKAKNIQGRNVW